MTTGDAFDVKVKAIVSKRTVAGSLKWQTDMRYELTNALPRPVTVDVLQAGLWGDTRIEKESQKSTRRSADVAEWALRCRRQAGSPANRAS